MVTHEADMAAFARTIVHFKDGLVERIERSTPGSAGRCRLMLGTTFLLAIRSIRRHMLRSFLTTLGIIIGVGAVVTMVTLGKATTAAVQKQISSLGTNILQIRPGQGFGRGGGGPRPPDFKPERCRRRSRNQIAGVTAVAPQAQSTATAIYEGANWSTTINGTTGAYFQVQPWPLVAGPHFHAGRGSGGQGGLHHRQYRCARTSIAAVAGRHADADRRRSPAT